MKYPFRLVRRALIRSSNGQLPRDTMCLLYPLVFGDSVRSADDLIYTQLAIYCRAISAFRSQFKWFYGHYVYAVCACGSRGGDGWGPHGWWVVAAAFLEASATKYYICSKATGLRQRPDDRQLWLMAAEKNSKRRALDRLSPRLFPLFRFSLSHLLCLINDSYFNYRPWMWTYPRQPLMYCNYLFQLFFFNNFF